MFSRSVCRAHPRAGVRAPRSARPTHCSQRSLSCVSQTYEKYGAPAKVLKTSKSELAEPSADQVQVKMLYAPINPADINMIEGVYGIKPQFPAVGGNEGVGVVQAVGAAVKSLKENDLVIPKAAAFGARGTLLHACWFDHLGTWRTAANAKEADLVKVPSDVESEYLATISVNPSSAYRMLADFEDLKEGDTIIQNGANSSVGFAAFQIAKARGIRTINIVRDRPQKESDDVISVMKEYGADIVVTEKYMSSQKFRDLISDIPKPKLALNCVGGDNALNMARHLAPHGTMVTYGAMSRQPFKVPASMLIFNDVKFVGFWMTRWAETHTTAERAEMYDELFDMIRDRKLRIPMEKHNFSEFDVALERLKAPFKWRKVLLDLQK